MRNFILLFTVILNSFAVRAQAVFSDLDRTVFENYKARFADRREDPIPRLLIETGKFFLDTPYVAFTLEGQDPERLIVNLRELDCTTFLETCVALVKTLKSERFSFENYCANLEGIRYRDGRCAGYPSRLHYFSDWIYANSQRKSSPGGLDIVDISRASGGVPLNVQVGYMTAHADKYAALNNVGFIDQIRNQEAAINGRSHHYIPKAELDELSRNINDGDIIAITTSAKGLDIAHVGLAYWKDGQLYFIHASQKSGKVIINPETLQAYLNQSSSRTGIMLARLLRHDQQH